MDRQRRANNPHNYNENGTVKKGKKKWKNSNHYQKTRSEAAELDVSRAYQSANGGKIVPASFGVGRRQSGSPVKPEATITELWMM